MMEIFSTLAKFSPGTIPGWALVALGLFYFFREWRETRKMSAEDRLARRDGYAKQVTDLTIENRALRADLVANEKLHSDYRRDCQRETDQLRGEIRSLEDEVSGLKRRIDGQGSAAARLLLSPPNAPSTIARELRREQEERDGEE